jgi:hypothetical protein
MKRCCFPLCFLICLLMFLGCQAPGQLVLNKLIGHEDAMLTIIKDNKADPKTAKAKLDAYRTEHKLEYAGLIRELEAIPREQLNSPQYEKELREFTEKTYELVRQAAEIGINSSFK